MVHHLGAYGRGWAASEDQTQTSSFIAQRVNRLLQRGQGGLGPPSPSDSEISFVESRSVIFLVRLLEIGIMHRGL